MPLLYIFGTIGGYNLTGGYMKKTAEEKLVEQIRQALDNHWFNPVMVAAMLVDENLFYQDKINELVECIIERQARMYRLQWEQGYTNQGLTNSSYLQEVIENRNRTHELI